MHSLVMVPSSEALDCLRFLASGLLLDWRFLLVPGVADGSLDTRLERRRFRISPLIGARGEQDGRDEEESFMVDETAGGIAAFSFDF